VDGFVTSRSSAEGIYLERHSNDLKLLKNAPVILDDDEVLEDFFQVKDKLILFTTRYGADTLLTLYAQELDPVSLSKKGVKRKLAKVRSRRMRTVDIRHPTQLEHVGRFFIRTSKDGSKLMVLSEPAFRKGDKAAFQTLVFDNDLQRLWCRDVALSFPYDRFTLQEPLVTDVGAVHLLGIYHEAPIASIEAGKANFTYQVISIKDQNAAIKNHTIETSDRIITHLSFDVDQERNIVCGGLYGLKAFNRAEGVCHVKVNTDIESKPRVIFNAFRLSLIMQGMSKSQQKRVEKRAEKGNLGELKNYKLTSVIVRNNGTVRVIAEQQSTTGYSRSEGLTSKTISHRDNLIVIKLSPTGEVIWSSKILKKQEVWENPHQLGYYAFEANGQVYILFNDNTKNYLTPDIQGYLHAYPSEDGNNALILAQIDHTGNATTRILQARTDDKVPVLPKFCSQMDRGGVLIYGGDGLHNHMGMLRFE
jgi:hypothetical protein